MRTQHRVLTWAIVVWLATLGGLLSGSIAGPRPAHSESLARPQVAAHPAPNRVQPQAGDAPALALTGDAPTCSRPVQYTDICTIEWSSLSATAISPGYMVSMTVSIDDRVRANVSGFFQTSMYAPSGMFGNGFKVACGAPGTGGDPTLGAAHSYTLLARDTTPATGAAYGTVFCPADIIPVNDATLDGPDLGSVDVPYTFAANVAPVTATMPVSYTWEATDQGSAGSSNGLSDARSYTWALPGTKTITVTAYNGVAPISATHTVVIARPVTTATLVGPAIGETGVTQTFTATAEPAAATPPLTYVFDGDELTPSTRSGGATATAGLTWATAGTKTVTVTVSNAVGTASAATTIYIEEAIAGLTASNDGPTNLGDSTRLVAQLGGGTDVVYAWTFGDDGTATTRVANHVYAETGSFTATVTASNDVGSASAATTVVVREPPPTGSLTGNRVLLPWTTRR